MEKDVGMNLLDLLVGEKGYLTQLFACGCVDVQGMGCQLGQFFHVVGPSLLLGIFVVADLLDKVLPGHRRLPSRLPYGYDECGNDDAQSHRCTYRGSSWFS